MVPASVHVLKVSRILLVPTAHLTFTKSIPFTFTNTRGYIRHTYITKQDGGCRCGYPRDPVAVRQRV